MESLDTAACFMDELLNFSSDIGEDDNIDDEDDKTTTATHTTSAVSVVNTPVPPFPLLSDRRRRNDKNLHFPEIVEEEELEWISNKDAFPMVESFVDILPTNDTSLMAHRSPISVLDHGSSSNSSGNKSGSGNASACASITTPNAVAGTSNPSAFVCLSSIVAKVPVKRARSKLGRRGRKDVVYEYWHQWSLNNRKHSKPSSTIGRKCLHCGAEKTPQWRAGPSGPKTLCNACGVRYKSGRLCAEYRPANSPSFSGAVHSNSHRKILEMRKQKEIKETKQVVIG